MRNKNKHDILCELERAILKSASEMPVRRPWIESERLGIIETAKKCLGVREDWIPRIRADCVERRDYDGFSVEMLRAESWKNCRCSAHLYLPDCSGPLPLVILCCGHGKEGKQTPGYQLMARRLALMGAAVLVPDNIGQGEREEMGHSEVIAPFQCGISLQGLIVMETMGWIDWALSDSRFDGGRIGAAGNSGGGTLTLFLGAFAERTLAALSSSGYPTTFEFIARKEKKHCHCNILPGIVGELEMWQIYGCFAPKPIYLFQGRSDRLFPEDIFDNVCRKVQKVYREKNAEKAFRFDVFEGEHRWDEKRRKALAEFLGAALNFPVDNEIAEEFRDPPGNCYGSWPVDALTADELACTVSGKNIAVLDELYKLYCPFLEKEKDIRFRRVGIKQLAAQFNAFLADRYKIKY